MSLNSRGVVPTSFTREIGCSSENSFSGSAKELSKKKTEVTSEIILDNKLGIPYNKTNAFQ